MFEQVFEIEEVLDARGSPEQRFYFVKWKGWDVADGSWKHCRELDNAQEVVDQFWKSGHLPAAARLRTIVVDGENRCPDCNRTFKRAQDLKSHRTKGCPRREASRAGSKTEKAVQKMKQVAVQDAAGSVVMEGKRLKNVFNFSYLGFNFQADGDRLPALEQRMAIAKSRFGQLHEIWRSPKLATNLKIRIFACAVVSILTYGNEIWRFTEKIQSKLKGWNARCLAVITGREIADECRTPSFDLVSRLRSRRLRWAGHILRSEESSLLRRMLLATAEQDLVSGAPKSGGLLMDAPSFASTEQLLELAEDREAWRHAVHVLLPESDPTSRRRRNRDRQRVEDEIGDPTRISPDNPMGFSDAKMTRLGFKRNGRGVWDLVQHIGFSRGID
jgi:hypothetical protein